MSIRKTIRYNQILMIITVVVLITSLFVSIKYIRSMAEIENDLLTLTTSVNDMLLLEHKLLLDKDINTIAKSGEVFTKSKLTIGKLQLRADEFGIDNFDINSLLNRVETMQGAFISLTQLQIAIGLTEDEGIRGKFRHVAHTLQSKFSSLGNLQWQIGILEIRRKEKDFLLRGNIELIEAQSLLIKQLTTDISSSPYDKKTKVDLVELLTTYKKFISILVDNLHQQGITSNNGLRHILSIEEAVINEQVTELTSQFSKIIQEKINVVLAIAALITCLVLSISFIRLLHVNTRIYKKLKSLSETMKSITTGNDFTIKFSESGKDEFTQLSRELNQLLTHFQVVLGKLSDAKVRMLRSERLVSLIEMVGGVAHELNTPLGNALTCESIVKDKIIELRQGFESGKIKRAEFKRIIDDCDEAVNLMESNLNKTDNLIRQFKEVTAFQNYEETVNFHLRTTIDSVLTSLKYEFKNIACNVEVQIPDNYIFNGYSGVIAQIIQMSLVNSVRHGYVSDRELNITISGVINGERELILKVQDDGRGVSTEHIKRVFEPFFTTKRNQGGTGLGLSVIYNLVTQKLNGKVYAESKESEGMLITISIPNMDIIPSKRV